MKIVLGVKGCNYKPSEKIDVWFDSLQSIASILSDKNRELINIIRQMKPSSIQELANITSREQSNLSRTLKTLEDHKIVTLEKVGKNLKPSVIATEFVIPISIQEQDLFASYKPRVVSLFSGCGGLDLGFEKAGYDIVFANDIEKSVKETYEYNIGKILIKSIVDVDKEKEIPNDIDVVLAGIPCQPFSNAGNRGSMEDDRGQLFLQVMQVIDIKKPKVVIFENVKGFLSAKDDQGLFMPERLSNELDAHGYSTHWKLLNASDYGVPQNRQRVFIVGIRKDLGKDFQFPEPLQNKEELTVGSVINKPFPIDEEEEHWSLSPQAIELQKFIPPGGSWKNVPYEHLPERLKKIRDDMQKYRSPNFYRRFDEHEIMGTITAAATPENSGILHPHKPRRYTVREIARFQSFPDTFKFLGESTAKKYKMIGNAVPPELAFHVANALKNQLFE
ncbi:modification methylase (Cytosine-specific methyltransferase)(HpaIIM-like) [Acinetobacter baumannii]|uniref:DNA (cytosine-5-)-methyltransferase n=1 Tax=Acinetobacter baumannii TaxID=470 RepID=UPI000DE703B6|nr:DNA (cytosine-5-)-methyltransferase [Acinetobacter baumannii]SSQ09241.1 modification methylase (Cytosine-specific methyltransferase)(HpaIIM-like) [Acinetobacter baumannii]SSQ41445.1 modification methylase (Cytosine-specific methyltransferase)(HpaIIM-like) [Acinetobacter baumannii]